MNPVHTLLTDVLHTGQRPTDAEIRAVVTAGASVRERDDARQGIRREAKRILSALDAGLPDQAALAVEAAAERYGAFTKGGVGETGPRELAAVVARSGTHTGPQPARPRNAAARELRQLFDARIRTGLSTADIDRLPIRDGATAEETTAWRADVLAAGQRIKGTFLSGNQGVARRLADEYAADLSAMIAQPELSRATRTKISTTPARSPGSCRVGPEGPPMNGTDHAYGNVAPGTLAQVERHELAHRQAGAVGASNVRWPRQRRRPACPPGALRQARSERSREPLRYPRCEATARYATRQP